MTGVSGSSTATEALAVAVAAGVPVVLWGPPGSGKSSVVQQLAAALDLRCEVVIASIREPSDFAGLPIVVDGSVAGESGSPSAAGGSPEVRFAPPAWATALAEAGSGLLFLDEISTAPPAVQAALLRVVLERTVGDLRLPDDVVVVAAANPPEQAADGWDLSAPLANRFCHLDWPVEAATVAEGLAAGFAAPAPPDFGDGGRSSQAWVRASLRGRSEVATFLRLRPGVVSAPPTDRSAAGRAWPSPRTWELAAELLAASRMAAAGPEVQAALVAGCVGAGPGMEFLAWLNALDLPDPEAVLADPAGFELPDRGDRAYAVLTAVAAAVAADPTVERWAAGWRVLGRAGEQAPDVAALAARMLVRCRPQGAPAPPEAGAFLPLLRQAGLA